MEINGESSATIMHPDCTPYFNLSNFVCVWAHISVSPSDARVSYGDLISEVLLTDGFANPF